jgi:hypothetical protein
LLDEVDDIVQGAIDIEKFVQEIMVCCIKSFTKVYKKCPGTQIVVSPLLGDGA